MHLVAITRTRATGDIQRDLPELARLLQLVPYDARLRLAGPLPIIAGMGYEVGAAQVLLAGLRTLGYGAIACATAGVPDEYDSTVVRGFQLGAEAITGSDAHGRPFTAPYGEIVGLLRAGEASSDTEIKQSSQKQLALGRAALTGGLVRNRNVTRTETNMSFEHQQVAFAFLASTSRPLVLKERELQYQGLGTRRAGTVQQNFAALYDALRASAPRAVCDDRLLAGKRRADQRIRGTTGARVVSQSNAEANLLAAYVLMHAHLHGPA